MNTSNSSATAHQLFADLPLLFNSSLSTREVISQALQKIREILHAEAGTVFLKDRESNELTFWVLAGGSSATTLANTKMPADRGIVGWVIENQTAQLVPDAHKDTRFFSEIELESKYPTRDLICVPLVGRAGIPLGALQVLNCTTGIFSESDLHTAEQIAPLLALALENAQLFETLEAKNRLLISLGRKKDEFISMITHEFQTPLNVVLTSSDLIASGVVRDPVGVKQLADTLTSGILRLSRAVSNIKTISNLTSKPMTIHRSPIALGPIVEELRLHFSSAVMQREISLQVDVAASLPSVDADPVLLRVLLFNLISNAIRFTPNGGAIRVLAKDQAGLVTISIQDTGIGIDPAHHEAIFERFYEVGSILHHSSGEFEFKSAGLGLGLAAARAIAEAHNAKIEVISVPNAGSTFSLRLPTA